MDVIAISLVSDKVDASTATLFDEELGLELKNVRNYEDLSIILGISAKHLGFFLHRSKKSLRYAEFEIRKKSGGTRTISAPANDLKILQKLLTKEFPQLRDFRPAVTGFLAGRGIIQNALPHVGQRHILNIDLEDFFGSINFGRIYGMFVKPPYLLPKQIAAALAKATTFNNKLPQGAPTSPILSNLICAKLDSQLAKLARESSHP